ncbi:MAG: AMP-binding protein, partial [Algicola sp.]|nr:AMP-binding protein [Algicola sp.]
PELAIQYADFAHWQRTYLEGDGLEGEGLKGEVLESQLVYWEQQLDEIPAVHSLPLDHSRPAMKRFEGNTVTGELSASVAKRLLAVATQHKLTPFMLLHGALSLMLSRHSNTTDIVIGTPVANRLQSELEPLIGFFVNTLVLRADTSHDTLADYYAHIRQVHLDAQSNQDVPFEQLVERLNAPRSTAHGPLFQILVATNSDYGLDDGSENAFTLPGVEIKGYESDLVQAKFDLEVELSISELGVGLHWVYDVSLFSAQYITQLNDHLGRLLEGLCHAGKGLESQSTHELPLLSVAEVDHLVVDLNNTQMDYPRDKCIHELFEQRVAATPDTHALIFAGKGFEDTSLSYKQLNEKANQLAHYLVQNHDLKQDTLIGLCVERSLEMLIGMLGILKAGAAYVPLDPNYPQQRLSYMLEDAALEVVLSQTRVEDVLPTFNGTVLMLDGLGETDTDGHFCAKYPKSNLSVAQTGLKSSNLAYVIYTSGSTGQPKGVLIEHRSVNNLVYSQKRTYGIADATSEVGLVLASYSFDAAVEQIFVMLLSSNTLVVPSKQALLDPAELQSLVTKHQVTHIDSTPSHLMSMVDCLNEQSVKRVISGGEAMIPQLVDAIKSDITLYNVYGPTETCVTSSVSTSADSKGKAVGNTRFLLFNEKLNETLTLAPK